MNIQGQEGMVFYSGHSEEMSVMRWHLMKTLNESRK